MIEEFDKVHQRMLSRMLEFLREGVHEEEEVSKDDCCDEHHPPANASQVLDESPKRNMLIKSEEWLDDGQEKLLGDPEVVSYEPLGVSDIRLEQVNLEHLGKSTTNSSLGMVLDDDVAVTHLSYVAEFSRAVEQKQVAQQEAERSDLINEGLKLLANPSVLELGFVVEKCLPSQELELSGFISCGEGMKTEQCCEVGQELALQAHRMERGWLAARLCCSRWKTLKLLLYENHDWKWTKSFPFILFDPGGCFTQSLQVLNQPVSETVEGSLGDYEEGMKAWAKASKLWMQMPAPKGALKRYEAASWLRKMVRVVSAKDLQAEPLEEEFRLGLRSGMMLSNVLNEVQPGAVQKVVKRAKDLALIPDGAALSAYQYFEKVRNFLVVVQEMGIPTFEASDLEEGGISAGVVNSVLDLKSYQKWKKPGALPTFVLLDRGDCFLALKVWNAQKAGAPAVLVADDVDEALIIMDSPENDSPSAKYIEDITIL